MAASADGTGSGSVLGGPALDRDVSGQRDDASRERLDAAVAAAVRDGIGEADRVTRIVLGAFDRCDEFITDLRAETVDGGQSEAVDKLATVLANTRRQATERLAAQTVRLETFNVVLFGRTSAGKSTLIEALVGGDGASISPGNMDWTTDIGEVRWRGCRLVDTPGIAGWGRTVDRALLEQRAKQAVEDADVVLLCFDATAALADEFRKTSAWIAHYGKPVVAILNARNARWRMPMRVPTETERRKLSMSVLEHAQHIRQELEHIGLPGVPVVAVHAQRAAFARTSDSYQGPFATSREHLRAEHGTSRLLEWSNLPALESLLAASLASHARELRLTMLNEQARGILHLAVAETAMPCAAAEARLGPVEKGIAEILKTVGRPRDPEFTQRLEALEIQRGGRFHVGQSMAEGFARDRLAQRLAAIRKDVSKDAVQVVDQAFASDTTIDEAAIRQRVFDPLVERCERAAQEVANEVSEFVEDRVTLICGDVEADLAAAARTLRGVDGHAGRTGMTVGTGLKIAAALVGLAALPALAVSGWLVAGAVALSIVLTAAGNKVRKDSARHRQLTRSWARAATRRSIQQTFRNIEDQLTEEFVSAIAEAAGVRLRSDVDEAIALRSVIGAAAQIEQVLNETQRAIPASGDARFVLTEVAANLQRQQFPGDASADRLLWLGETWCTDPEGLVDIEPPPTDANASARPLRHHAHFATELEGLQSTPQPGSGRRWLEDARPALEVDHDAVAALESLGQILDAPPLVRAVVVGDYSSGKSSFIRRLLVDTGSAVPADLGVGARPTTMATRVVPWAHGEIVDTPGFQSSRSEHADRAHDALVGASLVIFLFNPNLVVGAADDLVTVLCGARSQGRPARLTRTLFVINRADELGVDPQDDPDGFETLSLRKRNELAQALAKVARASDPDTPEITLDRIGCTASDPYGLVGEVDAASGAAFDRFRTWDGMNDVLGAIEAIGTDRSNAADLQVLEQGAQGLSELAGDRRVALDAVAKRRAQARYLQVDLDACIGRGHALIESARDELADDAAEFVASLWDEADAATKADRQDRAERLKAWDSDPEFVQLYAEWADSVDERLETWKRDTQGRVEERVQSAAFTAVFPDPQLVLDTDSLTRSDGSGAAMAMGYGRKAADFAAKKLKVVEKDTVLNVAHWLGYKFKPWGATKMTAKIAKVGAVIGVGTTIWDIYDALHTEYRQRADEVEARAKRAECRRKVRELMEEFFAGSDEAEGAGAPLVATVQAVEHERDTVAAKLAAAVAEEERLLAQVEAIDRQVDLALQQLEGDAR